MKKLGLFILLIMFPFLVFALPVGDVDGDGYVKSNDYILVRKHILKNPVLTGDKLTRANVDGKNGVNSADYIAIRKIIMGGGSTVTPTPKPTTSPITTNYTCTGEITRTGTRIVVSPTNNVKKYEWVINNKTISGKNIYNEYKIINNAKVNLVLDNGEKRDVKCKITDKLLYHFTYDLQNTGTWIKPEIQCNSYTAADKIKYDKMLKDAINEAGGKGTRGGMAEAARFLVGALEYRIIYRGPKKVDERIGRYPYEGLNIGNGNAWGCRVSGWTQGMDCTGFVEWVLRQNGFTQSPYSFPKSNTSEVIDKIKPGDILYTSGLTHVAIVAGIEGNIYYIAESVPGTNDRLGVTLHATKRETVLSTYTIVGNVPFTGEGNVNNMWLTE